MGTSERARRLLPGLWAGFLICIALVAAPTAFATLATADAGSVVNRMFLQEAYASLALGIALLVLERLKARQLAISRQGSQFSIAMLLALGAIFCTLLGYFAVQPMMPDARLGQGPWSFGQLHAASAACFAIKAGLVLILAWRACTAPPLSRSASS